MVLICGCPVRSYICIDEMPCHDGATAFIRLEALRKKLGWPENGIDNYMQDQGINSGTSRAKGYLSELGWRQGETQSYGEEDEY